MISTIDTTYNARFAFGWKILDRYYLGPEVQGFPRRRGRHRAQIQMVRVVGFAGLGNR